MYGATGCFGFVLGTVLVIWGCFHCCWAVLTQSHSLFCSPATHLLFLRLILMVVQNRKCDRITAVSPNALSRDGNSTREQTLYRKWDLLRSTCLDFLGRNKGSAVGLCYQRCILWVLPKAPWYSALLSCCLWYHLFLPHHISSCPALEVLLEQCIQGRWLMCRAN